MFGISIPADELLRQSPNNQEFEAMFVVEIVARHVAADFAPLSHQAIGRKFLPFGDRIDGPGLFRDVGGE